MRSSMRVLFRGNRWNAAVYVCERLYFDSAPSTYRTSTGFPALSSGDRINGFVASTGEPGNNNISLYH